MVRDTDEGDFMEYFRWMLVKVLDGTFHKTYGDGMREDLLVTNHKITAPKLFKTHWSILKI